MIIKSVPSSWLIEEEHRLDCGPFVKGSIEARKTLENLQYDKQFLVDLTLNGINGIYHVGQEKIIWAKDKAHGMPFLRSGCILKSDLSYQPYISRKQVVGNSLFQCPEGTTLISRSGSIGRMVYMRKDMEDFAISQDVLKVVPDSKKIKPGYLYALLNSRYGVPIVTGGTFGSIIVHIEAENIATLPVPRLGKVEAEVDQLINRAAMLREEASEMILGSIQQLQNEANLPNHIENHGSTFDFNVVSSNEIGSRLDGFFHSEYHTSAIKSVNNSRYGSHRVLDIAKSIVEPKRFKRVQVEPSETSIPFFGTTSLLWLTPKPIYHLAGNQKNINDYIVSRNTILIPRSGQLTGLIGSAILPYGEIVGGAVSEDAIRINCNNEIDAGFLYIALSSEYGRKQLKARAYGSSIPHLDVNQVGLVNVPVLPNEIKKVIGKSGLNATLKRDEAIHLEEQAISLVEKAIKAGGS